MCTARCFKFQEFAFPFETSFRLHGLCKGKRRQGYQLAARVWTISFAPTESPMFAGENLSEWAQLSPDSLIELIFNCNWLFFLA